MRAMLAARSLMIRALAEVTAARWPYWGTSGRISGMSSVTGVCCTWITRVSRRSAPERLLPASALASALGMMRA
ncbi:hypothetical protein D3C81_2140320 [compost metagenome]